MTFEINIKGKPLKFISSLQKYDRERLKEAILVLKQDPVPILIHRVDFRGDVYE